MLTKTGVMEKSVQNPWKISIKKFSFRKEFLEPLCKYIKNQFAKISKHISKKDLQGKNILDLQIIL